MADGVALVVVPGAGKREQLRFKIRKPWRALGQENLARLKLGRNDGHATGFVPVRFHGDDARDFASQFLNERGASAGVLDEHAPCAALLSEGLRGGLKRGVVDPPSARRR